MRHGLIQNLYQRVMFGLARVCYIKDSMLWARTLQWARAVHHCFQLVREPRHIRVLGCISSIREGQQIHCATDPERLNGLYAPHESQQHHGIGFKDLRYSC